MTSRASTLTSSRNGWRFWLGVLVSAACLVWLIVVMDWSAIGTALLGLDLRWALLAAGVNLSNVLLRAMRWRTLFGSRPSARFRTLTAALLIGQAGNVLLPARLGDVARTAMVASGNAPVVLGTIAAEISLDLVLLASLVVFLMAQVSLPTWWRVSGQATIVSGIIAVLLLILLVVGRRYLEEIVDRWACRWEGTLLGRMLGMVNRFLESLSELTLGTLTFGLVFTVLIWILYATVNITLLPGVGESPSVLAGLFVLAVLLVGVAVPSSPGRIGVFHYLCVQALTVFGVDQVTAMSYAIVLHLITVVLPVLLGALLAWSLGISLRAPRAPSESGQ